jgi:hypothetical protein
MNSTATLQLIIQLQSEAEGQLGAIRSQVVVKRDLVGGQANQCSRALMMSARA